MGERPASHSTADPYGSIAAPPVSSRLRHLLRDSGREAKIRFVRRSGVSVEIPGISLPSLFLQW